MTATIHSLSAARELRDALRELQEPVQPSLHLTPSSEDERRRVERLWMRVFPQMQP